MLASKKATLNKHSQPVTLIVADCRNCHIIRNAIRNRYDIYFKIFLQKPKRRKRPRRRRAGNCQRRRYNELINWHLHTLTVSLFLSFSHYPTRCTRCIHRLGDKHAYKPRIRAFKEKKGKNAQRSGWKYVKKERRLLALYSLLLYIIHTCNSLIVDDANWLCTRVSDGCTDRRDMWHCGRVREIAAFRVNVQFS